MKQICLIFLLFVLLAACTVPPAQQESCPSANLEDMDNPIDSAIKENDGYVYLGLYYFGSSIFRDNSHRIIFSHKGYSV